MLSHTLAPALTKKAWIPGRILWGYLLENERRNPPNFVGALCQESPFSLLLVIGQSLTTAPI